MRKMLQLGCEMALCLAVLAAAALNGLCSDAVTGSVVAVNLAHLDNLASEYSVERIRCTALSVYASYPAYEPVEAVGEGVACVDDAARAVVAYLGDYESTRREASLERAVGLVRFLLAMQRQDGSFCNFIRADGQINVLGETSKPGFAWYTGRAMWALGYAYRVLASHQPSTSIEKDIRVAFMRTLSAIDRRWLSAADFKSRLVNAESDVSSYYLLGLCEFHSVEPSREVSDAIRRLADSITLCQRGGRELYPFGIIFSSPDARDWHLWGSRQVQALARAYRELPDEGDRWLRAARLSADSWFEQMLNGWHVVGWEDGQVRHFPQISYGASVIVTSCAELFLATGDGKYLREAEAAAGWYFGVNPAGVAMYDARTGRCYDGIDEGGGVNLNSGAESTIEAVLALAALERIGGGASGAPGTEGVPGIPGAEGVPGMAGMSGVPGVVGAPGTLPNRTIISAGVSSLNRHLRTGKGVEAVVQVTSAGEYDIYIVLRQGRLVVELEVEAAPDAGTATPAAEEAVRLRRTVKLQKTPVFNNVWLSEGSCRLGLTGTAEIEAIVLRPAQNSSTVSK